MTAPVPFTGAAHVEPGGHPSEQPSPLAEFCTLLWMRHRCALNRIRQMFYDNVTRSIAALVSIAGVWAALYFMFRGIFIHMQANPLEDVLTRQFVFDFFFVILLLMLLLSNAILSFASLFARRELDYLLHLPLHNIAVVSLKFCETMAMSSWSLLLLGLPLMLAYGQVYDQPGIFYAAFMAYFLSFILIPAAAGMLMAFALAHYFPRNHRRALVILLGTVSLLALLWAILAWRDASSSAQQSGRLLGEIFSRLAPLQNTLMPSAWTSKGLMAASNGRIEDATRWLAILLANGLFISWLAVLWMSRRLNAVYDRIGSVSHRSRQTSGNISRAAVNGLFFFLPRADRAVPLKDLRTFLRDPVQWGQMLIFVCLLALYVGNVQNFPLDLAQQTTSHLLGFLGLTSILLILATFTSRFIYPLVSLETRAFWLVGIMPMDRSRLLWCKCAFSAVMTAIVAMPLAGVGAAMAGLQADWLAVQIGYVLVASFALSALSTGLGARFAVQDEPNPARIAAGFGGTVNLILSIVIVLFLTGSYAAAVWVRLRHDQTAGWTAPVALVAGVVAAACCSMAAMLYGMRHFSRREF